MRAALIIAVWALLAAAVQRILRAGAEEDKRSGMK